jgi:hypothetical protein
MIILSSRKLNWSKVVDFLSVLCINFKKFQKFLFSDSIDIMYDDKCPFFKIIYKILGTDIYSKDYFKKLRV